MVKGTGEFIELNGMMVEKQVMDVPIMFMGEEVKEGEVMEVGVSHEGGSLVRARLIVDDMLKKQEEEWELYGEEMNDGWEHI